MLNVKLRTHQVYNNVNFYLSVIENGLKRDDLARVIKGKESWYAFAAGNLC